MLTKVCNKCGVEKPIEDFNVHTGHYVRNDCKQCQRARHRKYYQEDRESVLQRQATYRGEHPEVRQAWLEKNPTYQRDAIRKWRETNKSHFLAQVRKEYAMLRERIIAAYGGVCSCCGESSRYFLQIDHKNNDGYIQRKAIGGSVRFYRWIVDNGFPDSLQILCANCNWGKRINNGTCPHNLEPSSTISKESTSEAIADGSAGHPWPVVYPQPKGEDIVTPRMKVRAALDDAEWI